MTLAIVTRNRLVALAPALSRLIKLPEKRPTPNVESRYSEAAILILFSIGRWTLSVGRLFLDPSAHIH
jgi:hypothetical protein